MTLEDYKEPKRLAPLSLLQQVISRIPGLAIAFYFAFFENSGENWFLIVAALIFGVFAIPGAVLSYFYFQYWITNDELIIHSGVLSRKQRHIPLRRVQNVKMNESFLHRILGLARIQIETAGDVEAEGVLDSVSLKQAQEIKEIIKSYDQKEITKADGDIENENPDYKPKENISVDAEEKENLLLKLSTGDLAKYGMMRFRPIILVFVGWIFGLGQQFLPNRFWNEFERYLSDVESYTVDFNVYYIVLSVVGLFITASLLSWVFDIIFTIFQYYNFKLTNEKNKLHTMYGLFNRRSGTIPLDKLQMMILYSNFIRKKLGFWSLQLETAGLSFKEARGPEVAIPFAKTQRVIDLTRKISPFEGEFEFKPVSRKTIRRAFIRYFVLFAGISTVIFFLTDHFITQIALSPLVYVFAYLRWLNRGYDYKNGKLFIKQGVIQKKIKIIPISKIQSINLSANFFQRQLNLINLYVDTAAGSGMSDASLIDLDQEEGKSLSLEIMEEFHGVNKNSL